MGYNFKSALNLQVQTKPSVREIATSRFTITGSNGVPSVTTTRAATGEERVARRESAGLPPRAVEVGDYTSLPASKRDVFLTGSHGLTSLYPAILLTTPRTSKVVDINSGLTATPFIIDLNNQIKKSVESDVKNALDRYAPILSLTNAEYDQSLIVANKYADYCLQAALQKDRIIELTNIINVDVASSQNQTQDIIIDGRDYQFLSNFPDVVTFMKNIDDNFKLETFTEGDQDNVNTKALVQVLKILHNQFLIGGFDAGLSSTSNNYILGSADYYVSSAITKLLTIEISSDYNTNTDFSFDDFKRTDCLIDLVRIVQRDLILQNEENQVKSFFGGTGAWASAQNALQQLIGSYKDLYQRDVTIGFFKTGYTTIDDFIEGSVTPTQAINGFIQPKLVRQDENASFNVLDVVKGHDYLLYDELAKETNSVNLDNLTRFSNDYNLFALKLRSFYQIFYKNDTIRKTCLRIIASNFLSFFTDSQITKTEFTSESSAARAAVLLSASKNDAIAAILFNLICKQASGFDDSDSRDLLLRAMMSTGAEDSDGVNLLVSGDVSDGNEGYFQLKKRYFDGGPGTSFGMFHNIAREIEELLANDNLTDDNVRRTTYSLGLNRNARAFVFYQMFLHILRNFYFRVSVRSNLGYNEVRIRYKPDQYKSIKFALANYNKSTEDFNNAVNNEEFSNSNNSNNDSYQHDARYFYSKYIESITRKINDQEQNCLDLVNLFINHSIQLSQAVLILKARIDSIKRILADNNMLDKDSVLNSIQTEQATLKKHLIDRYSNLLRGATYLPSAIDHNYNQALNTKTAVLTYPVLNDPINESVTKNFLVAIGLPAGLLESLRYQNSVSTSEHLYSIDLIFKNLQIDQRAERFFSRSNLDNYYTTRTYTFSSRVFINEGYQLADGADVKANQLTNYEQIYAATKYKVIDDDGVYRDVSPDDLVGILSSRVIVNNHLMSHYSKLLLKTTVGITLDEEAFDLVPQIRRYPDAAQDANYTTIVDGISTSYPNTTEGNLNKERTLRDLSRAIPLSPEQHKTSMMVSKTFERIHVIPIEINSIIEELQITNDDISFIDVVAKIRLEENQPPISFRQSPTRRNFAQATNDVAATFRQTDARSQSVSSVGFNSYVETSKKFSGMFGGS